MTVEIFSVTGGILMSFHVNGLVSLAITMIIEFVLCRPLPYFIVSSLGFYILVLNLSCVLSFWVLQKPTLHATRGDYISKHRQTQ